MTSNGLRYALHEERAADTFPLRAGIDVKPEDLGGCCLRTLNCEAPHQLSIDLGYQQSRHAMGGDSVVGYGRG